MTTSQITQTTVSIPGACGELVQGWHPDWEQPVLVSCPIAKFSSVEIRPRPDSQLCVSGNQPVGYDKVRRAVKLAFAKLDISDWGADITITSQLLPGRGMASSTADVVGAIIGVALAHGKSLLPETVARLALIPNIIGVKEATGNLQRAAALVAACPEDFAIYSGDDATAVELILLGGKGNISVTANVAPAIMARVCALAIAGDAMAARQLNGSVSHLHQQLFFESNPIPVKWALHVMGLIPPGIRLPLTPLAENHRETVLQALRQAGVLTEQEDL